MSRPDLQRLGLRLTVWGIVLALVLAVPALIHEDAWLLAVLLTLVALLLFAASMRPRFGEQPDSKPKIPRGFALVDHRSVSYPKAANVYGYEVRVRPTRSSRGLHWEAICDAPLLHARLTLEQVIQGELRGAWGIDSERLAGTSAVLGFSCPSLDASFDLWVQVDAPAPVKIVRIRRVAGPPAQTEAHDLMRAPLPRASR